jgi:hypothetical protein
MSRKVKQRRHRVLRVWRIFRPCSCNLCKLLNLV